MKPELSIIVITLNEEKYLPILLESLKNQTYKNFEIIVADFNSKDKTRKIAQKYRCKITLGGSYSVGRNNGAKIAKADYFLFLDADCYLPRNFIAANFPRFRDSNNGTGTVPLKPMSSKIVDISFFKAYDVWARIMSKVSPHCAGCGTFATREVFNKIAGFDERVTFAENHDFTRRARKYGFIILPEPMFTSVRRMEKEGRIKFMLKYIYAGLYRLFIKEINKELFKYETNQNG